MKYIEDYENPFDAINEFEDAISEFTGAPGVVVTDSCTHAIELGLRYRRPKMYATIPEHTYLSIPMTLMKLDIDYMFTDDEWDKEYQIKGSIVWDSARRFEKDMFERDPGQKKIVCVSFGHGKPFELGRGGAILTDDKAAYNWLKKAAYDGRDLSKPWQEQKEFTLGYHYMMRPEECVAGINKLASNEIVTLDKKGYTDYPNLRDITINK